MSPGIASLSRRLLGGTTWRSMPCCATIVRTSFGPFRRLSFKEGNRLLGVASPPCTMYLTGNMLEAAPGSAMAQALETLFEIEFAQNFVLSHAGAARDGIFYNNTDDQRHVRGYSRENGRLFSLPDAIRQALGKYHPFFFLDSSGYEPVESFLALRRAQEWSWA